jgi:c-di-GMP-binding flagellar brake protein YcgR
MRKEKVFVQKELISVGSSINISLSDYKEVYYSYVYDADNSYFYILPPTDNLGRKAHIKKSDKVSLTGLLNKERVGFESVVADIIVNEQNTIYKIPKSQDYYKYELRENFRVDVLIKAICILKEQKLNCSLLNISSSGAKVSLSAFTDASLMELQFNIEDKPIALAAKIVRVVQIDNKTFHYGTEFIDVKEQNREFIIKFCIKKQREILSARRI